MAFDFGRPVFLLAIAIHSLSLSYEFYQCKLCIQICVRRMLPISIRKSKINPVDDFRYMFIHTVMVTF